MLQQPPANAAALVPSGCDSPSTSLMCQFSMSLTASHQTRPLPSEQEVIPIANYIDFARTWVQKQIVCSIWSSDQKPARGSWKAAPTILVPGIFDHPPTMCSCSRAWFSTSEQGAGGRHWGTDICFSTHTSGLSTISNRPLESLRASQAYDMWILS